MKQTFHKSFFQLWVAQMVNNDEFIQDHRINSQNIGLASTGDLKALREVLAVYAEYIDRPKLPIGINGNPYSPEHKIRAMLATLPVANRADSIHDFIALIDAGKIEVI